MIPRSLNRLHDARAARLLGFLLALPALALTGCVSAKYRASSRDVPPAVTLHLVGASTDGTEGAVLEATLETVIIFQGPGSWKKSAYWDEYVVSLTNRSDQPLGVDSVQLTDSEGQSTNPGDDPWALDKASISHRDAIQRRTKTILAQAGTAYASTGLASAALFMGAVPCATAGVILGGAVAPAYIGTALFRNRSHRQAIEAEFRRRRLPLPRTIAPGETVRGSLFFRITPAPRQLALQGHDAAGAPREVSIALTSLEHLHLIGPSDPNGEVARDRFALGAGLPARIDPDTAAGRASSRSSRRQ